MIATSRPAKRVAYIVHDVNDAAVARRITMMRAGGLDVALIGFRRDNRRPADVAGAPVTDLGMTEDGRLARRVGSIAGILSRPARLFAACATCDVIVARNLESLVLGARVRRRRGELRLVYECLDLHRMLLGTSIASRAIQRVERALLARIDALLVSSPAFVREHLARRLPPSVPVLLLENKVLALAGEIAAAGNAPSAPPWTIGWFGNLRCRKTLDILRAAAARLDGRLEILIAGRASPAEFADFAKTVADAPHCTYVGPYTPADLPALYARCHFAWAIDYFEEGLNSSWLLPNRLYEAAIAHVVPIALHNVETGRWLRTHNAGLLLDDGVPTDLLVGVLQCLSPDDYAAMRRKIAATPVRDLVADADDCQVLAAMVTGA